MLKDNIKHLIQMHIEAKESQDIDKLVNVILALCSAEVLQPRENINNLFGNPRLPHSEDTVTIPVKVPPMPKTPPPSVQNVVEALNWQEPTRTNKT